MSHPTSTQAPQAPIVLNPHTLAKRAQTRAGNLAIRFSNNAALELELSEIEQEILNAYDLLSRVIMSGVKATIKPEPSQQTTGDKVGIAQDLKETGFPNQQHTGYKVAFSGDGYHVRVLCDANNNYKTVKERCEIPKGHRQVCLHCGFDNFIQGATYNACNRCGLSVVDHCAYVAIAGGV